MTGPNGQSATPDAKCEPWIDDIVGDSSYPIVVRYYRVGEVDTRE